MGLEDVNCNYSHQRAPLNHLPAASCCYYKEAVIFLNIFAFWTVLVKIKFLQVSIVLCLPLDNVQTPYLCFK